MINRCYVQQYVTTVSVQIVQNHNGAKNPPQDFKSLGHVAGHVIH